MEVRSAFVLYSFCFTVLYATKEEAPLSSSKVDARHFIDLIKRLGKEKGVDFDKLLRDEDTEDACITNKKLTKNKIIKSSESIAAGAKYISSHKRKSITECLQLCCDDSKCDTAVYQEKKEQECYLFVCKGHCVFTDHENYEVAEMDRRSPTSSQQPEEEAELANLHGNMANTAASIPDVKPQDKSKQQVPQVPMTAAPTPPPKPHVAPHTVGLSGFCTSDVSCEDPNAACFGEKCDCVQGFYDKAGLCRKICPDGYFECSELGSLTRGTECVHTHEVCDSFLQCADGSDEFNCEDLAGRAPGRSWNQQFAPSASSWPDKSDNGDYNSNTAGKYQAVEGSQAIQSERHQQPNHPQMPMAQNPISQNNIDQNLMNTIAQQKSVRLSNIAPSVRPNPMPTQHAISSMRKDNYMGGGNAGQLLPNPNPNTNIKPAYVEPSENVAMATANAYPVVNPNSQLVAEKDSHQRHPSELNPQSLGNPGALPNLPPNKDTNIKPASHYQQPVIQNSYPLPSNHQQLNLPQPPISNKMNTDNNQPDRFQGNSPLSQSGKPFSEQNKPMYSQQSSSRINNTASNSNIGSGKSGERKLKQPIESHYLSKPSDSSSSSLSALSHLHSKPKAEDQKANGRPSQSSSSADRISASSQALSGVRPSHYKSPISASSHSNRPDSSSWEENDIYMPYGAANQKLSPSARQPSLNQLYGQQSQYYRPYATDTLNSLPSSLLGNGGSQDAFSQFGGHYVEPQKSNSRLQYQLNGGNSGYLNYPDSSYGSQYPSPNRYNSGGDFSSSSYQDPDFYLSLGNPPVYHSDGLYDENPPADVSHSDNLKKPKDGKLPKKPETTAPPVLTTTSKPSTTPQKTSSAVPHSTKVNKTNQAVSKSQHHDVGSKEQVFLSREKVIIASSTSDAEGPIVALSLGLVFTIILIGLLACRLRNMKHRLRKGRPLNSNEADYLINGMYL